MTKQKSIKDRKIGFSLFGDCVSAVENYAFNNGVFCLMTDYVLQYFPSFSFFLHLLNVISIMKKVGFMLALQMTIEVNRE